MPPSGGTGGISCTKGSMAAAETVTFSPVVRVNRPAPKDGITNTASLTSQVNDPNPFNNKPTEKTPVFPFFFDRDN
jgi:Domain of unknown function DUF11